MPPIGRVSLPDVEGARGRLDVRFANPETVTVSASLRMPLAKCVMRCDKYRLNPLEIIGLVPYEPFANEVLEASRRA